MLTIRYHLGGLESEIYFYETKIGNICWQGEGLKKILFKNNILYFMDFQFAENYFSLPKFFNLIVDHNPMWCLYFQANMKSHLAGQLNIGELQTLPWWPLLARI